MEYFAGIEEALNNLDTETASELNGTITATNYPEYLSQIFYNVFIDYVDGVYNETDDGTLSYIADLCPGLYGTEVYQARALYDEIHQTAISYNEDCSGGSGGGGRTINPSAASPTPFTKAKKSNDLDFGIFPNPAQNEINIAGKKMDGEMLVRITDVNGRIVFEKKINPTANQARLKLDLQNGIYFVTLSNSESEKIIKKLVIAK